MHRIQLNCNALTLFYKVINIMKNVSDPVFFIGIPGSGTRGLFEVFASQKQLGWPRNYTEKFPTHSSINKQSIF